MRKHNSFISRNLSLQRTLLWLIIISIISIVTTLYLNTTPTEEVTRGMEITTKMLSEHTFLDITFDDHNMVRPPLYDWLTALIALCNGGKVTPFIMYLPAALSFLVLIVIFYLFVANRLRSNTAYMATLMMITTVGVHMGATNAYPQMLLATILCGTLFALYKWLQDHQMAGIPWSIAILISAGILTGGWIALCLPIVIFVIYLFEVKPPQIAHLLKQLLYLSIVSSLLPLVWYLSAWQQVGSDVFYIAGAGRLLALFSTPTQIAVASYEPSYKLLLYVLIGFMPWIFLSLFGTASISSRMLSDTSKRLTQYTSTAGLVSLFYLLVMGIHNAADLIILYPFMTLFMGQRVVLLAKNERWTLRLFAGLIFIVGALVLGTSLFSMWDNAPLQLSHLTYDLTFIKDQLNYKIMHHQALVSLLLMLLGVSLLSLLYQVSRRNYIKLAYSTFGVVYVLMLILL